MSGIDSHVIVDEAMLRINHDSTFTVVRVGLNTALSMHEILVPGKNIPEDILDRMRPASREEMEEHFSILPTADTRTAA